jgi:hypothetical protein
MKISSMLTVLLLGTALGLGVLALSAPIAAKPGWSQPDSSELRLTGEQREQIANLRAAFHARLKSLDWSIKDGQHGADTLREARELRMALREEIQDVLTEDQRNHLHSQTKRCPRGGMPVERQTTTLYL